MKYILVTRIAVCILVIVMSSFAFFPGKAYELVEKFSNKPVMEEQPEKNKATDRIRVVHVINEEPAERLLMIQQTY